MNIVAPELHPVPVVSPWYHIGIDLIGPISPESQQGNRYILTISDYFTKFVDAITLPDKEAISVAHDEKTPLPVSRVWEINTISTEVEGHYGSTS